MPDTPQRISERLSQLFEKRARRFKRASFYVKAMFLALASAVVSAAQFLQIPPGGSITAVQAVGVAGSLLVFAGAIFVLISEDDASEELSTARVAIEEARDAAEAFEAFDVYEDVMERAIQLYQSVVEMRRVMERAVVTGAQLEQVIASFMAATERSLPISLGFKQSDRWTLCVYRAQPSQADPGRDELVCIEHNRAIRCSINEARAWPEGVGAGGIAFSNRAEIVIPNFQDSGLGSVFSLGVRARDYDQDRYRSIAAVPINVDGNAKPWGVVVATNDRVNHFTIEDDSGLETTEPVRLLAGMIAVAVAVFERISPTPGGGGSGRPTPPAST